MTWTRAFVVFLTMVITGFAGFAMLESLNVNIYVRGGTVYFAMAMVAWIVARDYIQKNLLLGRSFAMWFFGTLATAIVVNLLIWRFWPR
ncbi:MAG: hypothetical protein ACRD09_10250 [Vicinamibacterales bacterium]